MDKASAAYASVGHPVRRTEDERHLHGAGRFVADIPWPGALHLAFVRSTVAHGVVRAVRAPALGRHIFIFKKIQGAQIIIFFVLKKTPQKKFFFVFRL